MLMRRTKKWSSNGLSVCLYNYWNIDIKYVYFVDRKAGLGIIIFKGGLITAEETSRRTAHYWLMGRWLVEESLVKIIIRM